MTIVLDKQIYTFYYNTHTVTQSTIDNKYLVQVLLVNCENSSKSVKTLYFFELPVQEKNLHKKQSFRLSTMI